MKIKVKKLHKEAKIPSRMTKGAAGFDLYAVADEPWIIQPYETVKIGTGLAFEIPEGYEMQIRSRSGLAINYSIFVINSPGTIDSDYRGEVCVLLHNLGEDDFFLEQGTRIAQAVITEAPTFEFILSDDLSQTERGNNGFGSTNSHKSR